MKRILLLIVALLSLSSLPAQTNKTIKELQNKRGELQEDISRSESLLLSTKKDVKSQLSDLSLISGQIAARKKFIGQIEKDVKTMNNEIYLLQKQLNKLKKELKQNQDNYEASVKYIYKNRTIQEKLMFIFSAQTLSQTLRRLRYVREYATYQRIQGEEVMRKQEQLTAKKKELEQARKEKTSLLSLKEAEQGKLQQQEKQQRTLVNNLQKKQKGLQNELARKRRQAQQLNNQIDRLIEQELAAAKKRDQQKATARTESKSEAKKGNKKGTTTKTKPGKMEVYEANKSDRKLSGSFEKNRGKLPPPITGPYLIVSHYGTHEVTGLKYVKLDNKGIDIKGQRGAKARAIFAGEVSAVFQYNGTANVLIRHGQYISVYCNLASTSVSRGQHVDTKQSIGTVSTDATGSTVLHFQLRKETTKLNPEVWLDN